MDQEAAILIQVRDQGVLDLKNAMSRLLLVRYVHRIIYQSFDRDCDLDTEPCRLVLIAEMVLDVTAWT
jgi:hypothetical protein